MCSNRRGRNALTANNGNSLAPVSGIKMQQSYWRCLLRTLYVFAAIALLSTAFTSSMANEDGSNWALLGNSADQHYHSNLSQINRHTVSRLGLAWSTRIPSPDGLVGNPLIEHGVIYQSGPRGEIYANELKTGRSLWVFRPPYRYPKASRGFLTHWASRFNRGLALTDGLVIVGTGNCQLIAVDQKTGKERWRATACNPLYEGITGAPRVGGGMVFIGQGCGDSGVARGHVDAFDARTGRHIWRFYTVPGDPTKPQSSLYEDAAKTWGKDWYSKTHGCGSPWDAMVYDPKLNLLYIGTGGPAPFTPTQRGADAGDELFTNAVVALNARTGHYVWHFTETPHDGWNYEASVGLLVANLPYRGHQRRVVISVPKNGFLYVLDAKTGKFLSGSAYAPINWASGLTRNGRPKVLPIARYWEMPDKCSIVVPSNIGEHSWEAMAFNPRDHLLYIPVEVMPTRMCQLAGEQVGGVSMDFYAGKTADGKITAHGELVAWDPASQSARWRVTHSFPVDGGVLQSGDLVFQGAANGRFSAYDAYTGKRLWSVQLDGVVRAAPSTVLLNGVQYLIVASGNTASSIIGTYVPRYSVASALRRAPSRLLAFTLGGKERLPVPKSSPPIPRPAVPRFADAISEKGGRLFEANGCVDCHGLQAQSAWGSAPDLRYSTPDPTIMHKIVVRGIFYQHGMPRYKDLSGADIRAIYAFVINEAWNAYGRQKLKQGK